MSPADIALVAESDQDVQQALTTIDDTFILRGTEISVRKTQIMRLASTASVAPQEDAVLDPMGFSSGVIFLRKLTASII